MDPIRNQACVQHKSSRGAAVGSRQPMDHNKYEGLALALFHESEDALILFDAATMNILDLNVAAQRLCGMSLRDLLDSPVSGLLRSPRCDGFGPEVVPGRQAVLPNVLWGFELKTFQSSVWLSVDLTVTRLVLKPQPLVLLRLRTVNHEVTADDSSSDHTPLPAMSTRGATGKLGFTADSHTSKGDTV